MQTPIRVIQTSAEEAHGQMESGRPGGTEEGAERRYPTRERKLPGGWFQANITDDALSGPTRPTLGAEDSLEKGPDVDRMGVVNLTRERPPSSKHGASGSDYVWVTPRAKEKASNRKG
jgi:hypothetical protein